jgi:hypothetical protein
MLNGNFMIVIYLQQRVEAELISGEHHQVGNPVSLMAAMAALQQQQQQQQGSQGGQGQTQGAGQHGRPPSVLLSPPGHNQLPPSPPNFLQEVILIFICATLYAIKHHIVNCGSH